MSLQITAVSIKFADGTRRRMKEAVGRGLRAVADLILPRTCIVCRRKLLLDERHLCLHCLADIPLTGFWQMEVNPMADRFNSNIQSHLEKQWDKGDFGPRENYALACALFFFDQGAGYRHIPYQIKYSGNLSAGQYFGKMLGEKIARSEFYDDVDIIIPVPLHWRRHWKRGYNQAEIIAKGISEAAGIPVRSDILKRTRHTRTQVSLDIPQKTANVTGAFSISRSFQKRCASNTGKNIEDIRHILLVDDVFTTGSTLTACFTALRTVFPPSVRISVATLGFVGEV